MAVQKLSEQANVKLSSCSIGLASPARLEFTTTDSGADFNARMALDDLAVIQYNQGGSPKTFFKGYITKIKHSVARNADGVVYTAVGVEDIVEAAPWEPIYKAYNTPDVPCQAEAWAPFQTIDEVMTREHTGLVATWFNSIVYSTAIGNLIAGATESYQKGFFSWLSDLLKPYPYIGWRIDYLYSDVNPVFPLGNLVLIDLTLGDTARTMTVGQNVRSLEVVHDHSRAAENLRVWGRGDFEETYEVLMPDWEDELVSFGPVDALLPDSTRPEEATHVYLGHDFIDDMDIQFQTHPNPDGVSLPIQAWEGSDYTIDKTHGRIYWNPQNYWINDATGDIQYTLNSPGAGWRRPVAYNNNHTRDLSSATMSYKFMHPDAFRKYKTSAPIANIRLSTKTVPQVDNPGSSTTAVVEADSAFDAYKPIFNPTGVYDSDPPADGFWKEPEARAGSIAEYVGHNVDTFDPATYTIMSDFVLRPNFTEGTTCVYFDKRQLLPINAIFKHPDAPNLRLVSWDVIAHYTKWLDLLVTRTLSAAPNKYANYVYEDIYKYTDVYGTTFVDSSVDLTIAAQNLEAYLEEAIVTGSAIYVVDKSAGEWDVPFNVGDRVTFDGEVNSPGPLDAIRAQLLINRIDLSNIEKGTVAVSFGPYEPKASVFVNRANLPTHVQDTGRERLDISRLEGF